MKKISLAIITLVVAFAFTYAMPSNRVDALVISKAASTTAKVIAKDFIKESAKEIAFEMALQAISQTWDAKNDYKFEDNYDHYCAYEITPDGKCTQVMKVKKDLTAYDIEQLDDQLEIEIDKHITSGAGFTKWQKFMDWFLPIWLVSFALTALTYAIDSDVRSLFNEIAYSSLVALGFIKPVEDPTEPTPFRDVVLEPVEETPEPSYLALSRVATGTSKGLAVGTNVAGISIPKTNVVFTSDIIYPNTTTKTANYILNLDNKNVLTVNLTGSPVIEGAKSVHGDLQQVKLAKDGVTTQVLTVNDFDLVDREGFAYDPLLWDISANSQTVTKWETRLPYKYGDSYYTDFIAKTNDGHDYEVQLKSSQYNEPTENYKYLTVGPLLFSTGQGTSHQMIARFNQSPNKVILPPVYADIEDVLDPVGSSKRIDETGKNVALVPSSAIPYTDSTGTLLTPEVVGEEVIFKRPDGTIVPDEEVIVGSPNVTDSPEGVPQVTPPSTQTNPNPVPIPLVPAEPPPPPPDTPSPPPEDGGGGKPNIPLSLLLGLFKLLFAIIFYLIRMFTFIVTIQFIQPIPIPNPYFIWFTTAEILGVQPYPLIKNIALFFLSFSIYKSIRRVFG